jgi:hypothetical protein
MDEETTQRYVDYIYASSISKTSQSVGIMARILEKERLETQ